MKLLFVMIGGTFGSILRYHLGEWIYSGDGFPFGTLSINAIGCFILGWFLTYIDRFSSDNQQLSLFIGTGFIGSFTTFSTFSVETLLLVQNGLIGKALLYIFSSIVLGILLSYVGYIIALLFRRSVGGEK